MHSGDLLGDEGRKALNACVKVKIIGRPATRRYDYYEAHWRLKQCYAGNYPDIKFGPFFRRRDAVRHDKIPWLDVDQLLLPRKSLIHSDNCDIIDIHKALVCFDEILYVEKYPGERTGSDELKDLIDKRRADVKKEFKEATANPDGKHRYSWLVAQRRVRDCYAGNFTGDSPLLESKTYSNNDTYNITEIHDAFVEYDDTSIVNNYRKNKYKCKSCSNCKEVEERRADIDREYGKAIRSAGTAIEQGHKYNRDVAQQRVKGCFGFCSEMKMGRFYDHLNNGGELPIKQDENGKANPYSIFDICKAVCCIDQTILQNQSMYGSCRPRCVLFEKYPNNGPGSDKLKKLIDEHRANLKKEYQEDKLKEYKYSRNEAERRVRDCFAGSFISDDTEIFCSKGHVSDISKIHQTYDIFDIQKAIKYFDSKKLVEKYSEEKGPEADKQRKLVDEERDGIEREYAEAIKDTDLEHGSGFIIQDHFIITNKHVIQSALDDETKKIQILISNAAIGDHGLPCEVVHYDVGKDLALLYCKDLNLDGICPLKLSNQSLLPGMQIFSFGFPISHTEETALFVNGYVSGSKKMLSGHTMAVLNCALNSGNSGGPVLCWVKGQLRVVGVATQKHFKEILTPGQRQTIEKMRKMLQTSVIPELPEFEKSLGQIRYIDPGDLPNLDIGKTSMFLLTLKLCDALETHSQFNLSNALPGDLVIEFVKKSAEKYNGDCKDKLAEIVKTF